MIAVNRSSFIKPTCKRESLFFCEAKQEFYSHEIIMLSANVNYTNVYLTCGKVLLISKTLKKFEESLTKIGFLRIHKSAIINPAYIKNATHTEVKMDNGLVLKISRRRKSLMGE